jgi:hypothetical protein
MKIGSNLEKIITKMISAKNCTNPESFNGFARGRRIDWRDPMDTPLDYVFHIDESLAINFKKVISNKRLM